MSYISVNFNGNTYTIPASGEVGPWAAALNQFLQALASGAPGLNVANTFTAAQSLDAPVALVKTTVPAQSATAAKIYTDTADGFMYVIPASPNSAAPIKITATPVVEPVFAAKTSAYAVLAADSQTRFSNQGALASVTFTLPTPAVGLEFYFACTAAQVLVVTGASVKGPASLSGTTITVNGTLATNRYTSFKVGCYDGAVWVVQELTGSVVVS